MNIIKLKLGTISFTLLFLCAIPFPFSVTQAQAKNKVKSEGLSILQGVTNESSTQISILAPKGEVYRFVLTSKKTKRDLTPFFKSEFSFMHSKFKAFKLIFQGLQLNKKYKLRVMNSKSKVVDTRILWALNTKGKKPMIALAACMDDSLIKEQKAMWKELLSKKPDYLFMLGDNAYVNRRNGIPLVTLTPETIWDRYVETRNTLQIYKEKNLIPTVATWDDNDYGLNNGGKDFEYREATQRIFKSFFAQDSVQGFFENGPGISGVLKVYGQQFVFLDNRTFRTLDNENTEDQAHFGETQLAWLESVLSSGEHSWLIAGDQFFGAHHPYESFEGNHNIAFKKFLARLKSVKSTVAFISGDRHLAEILDVKDSILGYKTIELTTSPIHAKTYSGTLKKHTSKKMIFGVDGKLNFAILEPLADDDSVNAKITLYGEAGKKLFGKSFKIAR